MFLQISTFGLHCPVTFGETGEQVIGELHSAIIFRQKVYFCLGEERRQRFSANPFLYLATPIPKASHLKIVIVGPPGSVSRIQSWK
jgi:hypothetical protein